MKIQKFLNAFPDVHPFYENLGNTPLLQFSSEAKGAKIFAKLEKNNPTGSIKDRTAFAMLADLFEKVGKQKFLSTEIIEYSGGNLAISLGHLTKILRIPCRLVLSESMDPVLKTRLQNFNCHLDWVNPELGFLGVMHRAEALAQRKPCHFLYQHRNLANFHYHRQTTGFEISKQLGNRSPTAWVAAVGTGGTFAGVESVLRALNRNLKIYAVTPSEMPYGTEAKPNSLPKFSGSGGLGYGLRQPLLSDLESKIDSHFTFSFVEVTKAAEKLKQTLGFQVGTSSAANWLTATHLAEAMSTNDNVVTVFPS